MMSFSRMRKLWRRHARRALGAWRARRFGGSRLWPQPACDLSAQCCEPATHRFVAIERDVPARGFSDRVLARNMPLEDMKVRAPGLRDLVPGHVPGVLLARHQRILPMR